LDRDSSSNFPRTASFVTMSRLALYVKPKPITPIVILNLRRRDGGFERLNAIVDTGAEVTFLPAKQMIHLAYRVSENSEVKVEQAGIANQRFNVLEAYVEAYLEDEQGNVTQPFETKIWFGTTTETLLGVEQMLDRAILHLDMPALTGYLEFPD
jgi:hypothetical protein